MYRVCKITGINAGNRGSFDNLLYAVSYAYGKSRNTGETFTINEGDNLLATFEYRGKSMCGNPYVLLYTDNREIQHAYDIITCCASYNICGSCNYADACDLRPIE